MKKKRNKIFSYLLVVSTTLLFGCGNNNRHDSFEKLFPKSAEDKNTSFAFASVIGDGSYSTGAFYCYHSHPSNKSYLMVKLRVLEDMYNNIENGTVVLLPMGISSSHLEYEPCDGLPSDLPSLGYKKPYVIPPDVASFYISFYCYFGVYLKNARPVESETYLRDLNLYSGSEREVNIDYIKDGVDYVSEPMFFDRDFDLLPFNAHDEGKLVLQEFYSRVYYQTFEILDQAVREKYEYALSLFKDNVDTFYTVKNDYF